MANRTREEPRSVGRPRRNPKRVGLCCKSIDFRGAFIRGVDGPRFFAVSLLAVALAADTTEKPAPRGGFFRASAEAKTPKNQPSTITR